MSPDNSVRTQSAGRAFSWTAATIAYYEQTLFDSLRRLYRMAVLAEPINEVLYRLRVRSRTQHRNVIASLRQYQALELMSALDRFNAASLTLRLLTRIGISGGT